VCQGQLQALPAPTPASKTGVSNWCGVATHAPGQGI
jgi:hypothetical protein